MKLRERKPVQTTQTKKPQPKKAQPKTAKKAQPKSETETQNTKTTPNKKRKIKITIEQENHEKEPEKKLKTEEQKEQKNEENIIEEEQQQIENNEQKQNKITNQEQIEIKTSNFVQKQRGSYTQKYNQIQESDKLGEGNEGSVYKVHEKNSEDRCKAMKIIKKSSLISLYKNQFIREIELLKTLDHPNILKIYEFYEDQDNFYLIEEYMEGKDLFDEILDRDTFTEKEAAQILKQVLSALILTHKNKLVHRDIKPDNIFVIKPQKESEESNDFDIKIIDFGICDKMDKNEKLSFKVGTLQWCAPEIIKGEVYNEKCDIWSAGCILYTILAMEPPFMHYAHNPQKTQDQIILGFYDMQTPQLAIVSEQAKDLIKKMLETDPEKRISAQDALEHPWIQQQFEDQKDQKVNNLDLERLKSFNCQSKLHQACIGFIASHLITDKEKNELKKTFQKLDKNGDGILSREEIQEGLQKIYGEEEAGKEVERIFKAVDVDNSGFLDYTEFIMASMNKKDKFTKRKMKTVFELFDKDGDGQITIQELKEVFCGHLENIEGIDSKIWDNIISEVDEDSDGQISFEEFQHFMLKMAGPEKDIVSQTQ